MIKKRMTLLFGLIGFLIIVGGGFSYAYFRTTATQTDTNQISTTSSCINISFSDQNDRLNITNAYPLRDEDGEEQRPYQFSLTNTCQQAVRVKIGFELISGTTLTAGQLKAGIAKRNMQGTYDYLNNFPIGTPLNNGTAYVLKEDYLEYNDTIDYDFRMWLPYELTENDIHGKVLNGKIVVDAIMSNNNVKSPNYWEDPAKGSLIAGIKKNYPKAVEPLTSVFGESYAYNTSAFSTKKSVASTYRNYYWTYGDSYGFNTTSKKFYLDGIHKVLYSSNYSSLVGKYFVSSNASSNSKSTKSASITTNNITTVYKAVNVSSSYIYMVPVESVTTISGTYKSYYWPYKDAMNSETINMLKYNTSYQNLVGKYVMPKSVGTFAQQTNSLANVPEGVYGNKVTRTAADYYTYKYEAEAEMSEIEDDYGISYFFRGTVEDNYVSFANMCWRIVRIDGAGNIKLILYNYNPSSATNPCSKTEDGITRAYARYDNTQLGTLGLTSYNSSSNSKAYVGYMYGNTRSSDYDLTYENTTRSTILDNLVTWYDAKLRSYNDKLADVIWCNDKSLNSIDDFNNSYFSFSYYDKMTLASKFGAELNLKCPDASGNVKNLSRYTASDTTNGNGALKFNNLEYKIGLLTRDEYVLSGYGLNYLFGNTGEDAFYWSMSPGWYDNSKSASAAFYYTYNTGSTVDGFSLTSYLGNSNLKGAGLRPMIALKYDTMISSGVGTQENPFVVS